MPDKRHKRDFTEFGRLVIVIALIAASVLIARDLLNVGSYAAIGLGGTFTYAVSVLILRRLLPRPAPLADEERVRSTPRMRTWLVVDILCIVLVHFGGKVSWGLSAGVIIGLSACVVVVELHMRRQAADRIGSQKQADA